MAARPVLRTVGWMFFCRGGNDLDEREAAVRASLDRVPGPGPWTWSLDLERQRWQEEEKRGRLHADRSQSNVSDGSSVGEGSWTGRRGSDVPWSDGGWTHPRQPWTHPGASGPLRQPAGPSSSSTFMSRVPVVPSDGAADWTPPRARLEAVDGASWRVSMLMRRPLTRRSPRSVVWKYCRASLKDMTGVGFRSSGRAEERTRETPLERQLHTTPPPPQVKLLTWLDALQSLPLLSGLLQLWTFF